MIRSEPDRLEQIQEAGDQDGDNPRPDSRKFRDCPGRQGPAFEDRPVQARVQAGKDPGAKSDPDHPDKSIQRSRAHRTRGRTRAVAKDGKSCPKDKAPDYS